MRNELEQKLVDRWPTWFDVNGDPRLTRMADGFAHGDGWFDLLWKLCEQLEPVVREWEKKTGEPWCVLQVKEKFGGLRFYVSKSNDRIRSLIEAAEERSYHTPERPEPPESSPCGLRCEAHAVHTAG